MSVETMLDRGMVNKSSPLDYPECNGRPGSSSYNWVPVDFLGYQLARILRVTDEDIKKKQQNSNIIEPK